MPKAEATAAATLGPGELDARAFQDATVYTQDLGSQALESQSLGDQDLDEQGLGSQGAHQKPAQNAAQVPASPSLGAVVGSLAHDLNNLLQIISTTTQLLRLREQNKDSQLFLGDIASATDRAAHLTCQLLDAARVERRRLQHSERPSSPPCAPSHVDSPAGGASDLERQSLVDCDD